MRTAEEGKKGHRRMRKTQSGVGWGGGQGNNDWMMTDYGG